MITKVTGRSHNAKATLRYIFGSYHRGRYCNNRPHKNKNGINKRNLLVSGIDCPSSYHGSYRDFKYWLKQKPHNKVKTCNVVLSFKGLNPRRGNDVAAVSCIGRKFCKRAFPNHSAVVAVQADNTNAVVHCHVVVCAINKRTLKTIPGSAYGIGRLRRISNKVLADYQRQNGYRVKNAATNAKQQQPNDYQQKIIEKLKTVINNDAWTSQSGFRKTCREKKIRASFKSPRNNRRKRPGLVYKIKGHNYIKASTIARWLPGASLRRIELKMKQNRKLKREKRQRKHAKRKQTIKLKREIEASQQRLAKAEYIFETAEPSLQPHLATQTKTTKATTAEIATATSHLPSLSQLIKSAVSKVAQHIKRIYLKLNHKARAIKHKHQQQQHRRHQQQLLMKQHHHQHYHQTGPEL